jgi:NTP pyrophosphatase (non-canonical NTP hydrolase)
MTGRAAAGSAVVLVDPRLGAVLPAEALPVVRAAADVYAGAGLPAELGAPPAPAVLPLDRPVVVIATALTDPAAAALHAAGAPVLSTRPPAGAELLAAVAVMDRLRSPGGCPWDAEQTHLTLRRYLEEEAYELLEAIEDGDRAAMREELGDVLLQVLFHARVAAEDPADPFTVDDVAAGLVDKLISRHPHVFAGGDPAVRDAVSQEHRWDQLKQIEKQRESSVDGVPFGMPAVSLAAKLAGRATKAGLPADLLPSKGNSGAELFALAAATRESYPEGELGAVCRRFARDVRAAEAGARAAGVDPLGMSADDWRRFWPR